ncbi:hypothetical protein Tco_1234196, partial [Tanacetum coccineum]
MEKVNENKNIPRSCLASRIKNIDGKILGKDGKPLRTAFRHVHFGNEHDVALGENPSSASTSEDLGNVNPSSASPSKGSFAAVVTKDVITLVTKSKFRMLLNAEQVANADVVLPVATLSAAQQRYANSLVGYFVGKSVMLDAFTNNMCSDPWGRMGYARALIEVSAEKELKQEVIMAIPEVEALTNALNELLNLLRKIEGLKLNTPKSTFVYRPNVSKPARTMETKSENIDLFKLKNQFDSLRNQDDTIMETEVGESSELNKVTATNDLDSESEVEEIEMDDQPKGASTPSSNNPSTRRTLWSDLEMHKLVTRGVPWTLMGDFNMALNLEDYSSSSSKLSSAISDFKDCVYNIEVMDVNS